MSSFSLKIPLLLASIRGFCERTLKLKLLLAFINDSAIFNPPNMLLQKKYEKDIVPLEAKIALSLSEQLVITILLLPNDDLRELMKLPDPQES